MEGFALPACVECGRTGAAAAALCPASPALRLGLQILRASVFHTPANPFHHSDALISLPDGALAIENGIIAACDTYATVHAAHPDAPVRDLRPAVLLPGFIDTHIHYPQVRILGGLGHSLLDWLEQLALPEEARLADPHYATALAREFVQNLAAHGTTTSLVFGAHFPAATAALFEAAHQTGLRLISGMVLSDRNLRPELHQSPQAAYDDSKRLIEGLADKPRLSYAVIPRFALSASEPMLQVCETLLREHPGIHFTTHLNENPSEIAEVARLFPWAQDYLHVYERFGLATRRSVFAHNVHATADELRRLSARNCSIAHCPASNAALGSGIFPLRRHLDANVRFALGTDVGAGTGFGIPKEALQAYLMQRVAPEPVTLTPAQMLWLSTGAGAEALDLQHTLGNFTAGKCADYVLVHTPGGTLAQALCAAAPGFISEVAVSGVPVFRSRAKWLV
jgi:guanine deaminase